MRRRSKATPKRRAPKRRNAPNERNPNLSATNQDTGVARLTRERDEALEQQVATAEVLNVISSSPAQLEPVFHTILANATRICGAKFGTLYLRDGDSFRAAAFHNAHTAFVEARKDRLIQPDTETTLG